MVMTLNFNIYHRKIYNPKGKKGNFAQKNTGIFMNMRTLRIE